MVCGPCKSSMKKATCGWVKATSWICPFCKRDGEDGLGGLSDAVRSALGGPGPGGGPKPEGSGAEGSDAEGSGAEGSDMDMCDPEGSGSEGSPHEGSDREGSYPDPHAGPRACAALPKPHAHPPGGASGGPLRRGFEIGGTQRGGSQAGRMPDPNRSPFDFAEDFTEDLEGGEGSPGPNSRPRPPGPRPPASRDPAPRDPSSPSAEVRQLGAVAFGGGLPSGGSGFRSEDGESAGSRRLSA